MSAIRSTNTKLERLFFSTVGSAAHREGYRYRKYYAGLPGTPDLAFPKHKLAVFVDSSFWHGRNIKAWYRKLRTLYWRRKIEGNIIRDASVNTKLRAAGWKVLRIWDADLLKKPYSCKRKVITRLSEIKYRQPAAIR